MEGSQAAILASSLFLGLLSLFSASLRTLVPFIQFFLNTAFFYTNQSAGGKKWQLVFNRLIGFSVQVHRKSALESLGELKKRFIFISFEFGSNKLL